MEERPDRFLRGIAVSLGSNTRLCVVLCVVTPFILDVRLVDAPAGVTQEEGHTEFLHLPSAVLALFFIVKIIQPYLSLVDREVQELIVLHYLLGICKEKSQFV